MPLQATSGAASYDAFGGGAAAVPQYIEDVFSTYLYTGTGAALTITNNIDLSTKGGLVWTKQRGQVQDHLLADTARGNTKYLSSNTTDGEGTSATRITSFDTTGYTLGTGAINGSTNTYVSWTFRKQPKFFDVVTYTGTGSNTTISHSLGSVPASIWVKRTDTTGAWQVYHRSLANTEYLVLNDTAAKATGATRWNSTTPTSTVFSLGTDATVNASGGTYVAYIFAHDAGGFGLTGTDNVISCGSYTGNGLADGPTVSLGYEPQWLLIKNASVAESGGLTCNWRMYDNMRGLATGGDEARLFPNLTNAENFANDVDLTSTGFKVTTSNGNVNGNGEKIIYIAIRRGPMKVPTVGTSVFSPNAYTGAGAGTNYTTNFPVDSTWVGKRNDTASHEVWDRLRGPRPYLFTDSTAVEGTAFSTNQWLVDSNTKVTWSAGDAFSNTSPDTFVTWNFKRAPSFFDVVCWIGDGINGRSITHNLNVEPELIIAKQRSVSGDWIVYVKNNGVAQNAQAILNGNNSFGWYGGIFPSPFASSTTFQVASNSVINGSGNTYVAYLFATCAGVSKVGTYTGNGSSQTINCGFTGGARFVLIKKSSGTGDWIVSDSARGIVSGNDPYLELNNTNAEVTGEDWLDTDSTGFVVNEVSGSNANTSSATYIFLAIA
jgi:hypothetical protein